ncbi:hypothetical protein ENSA5_20900 [Enhygromyxa salina]|uniref:Uncharacterized protein n=1 Tax=Enhygromyxa salina TaxID=215803 RepID=A0A2S9YC80_9BACT|nr:HAMP domain-containing histidine kinase [Enhygromyxa salina]PRQ02738.1 hypothetical protein ENSA5_20900 [Enhygromyxa salina]
MPDADFDSPGPCPCEDPHTRARRLAGELRLARAVHERVIHELGNPLQSLAMLVELTRDELRAQAPDGPGVARLDRALVSVERIRRVLVASGRVRARLSDGESRHMAATWGRLLDELLGFVGERVEASRARLVRETAEIDRLAVEPSSMREATLAALVGVCAQLRAGRGDEMTVKVRGRVSQDQLCLTVALQGPGGPLEIEPQIYAWVDELLADARDCDCRPEAGALAVWAPATSRVRPPTPEWGG